MLTPMTYKKMANLVSILKRNQANEPNNTFLGIMLVRLFCFP